MEDDSSVLKYIDIVPFDNSAQQFEDVKPFQVRVFIVTSGTGTNLKVGGGAPVWCKAPKKHFGRAPPVFGSKSAISRFLVVLVCTFEIVSTVWSVSC